jgi:hypothetical protein
MRPDAAVGVDHFIMEVHIRLVAEILAQQVQQVSCHINNPHEIMVLRFNSRRACPTSVRVTSKWCGIRKRFDTSNGQHPNVQQCRRKKTHRIAPVGFLAR